MRFGIYIHFPWCRNRCPYCDFAIAIAPKGPPHTLYLDAVLAELAHRAESYDGKELVSIYFGGGTPSLWEPRCIAALIDACCQRFAADASQLEISLECNPSDCTEDAFSAWQNAGINRLLIGVQATNAQDLVTLGRDHAMGDGLSALKGTVNAGFASVGADVILGVPSASKSSAGLASLRDVAALRPQHISAYELTIEERTPFAKMVERGELIPEEEDRLADIYLQAHDILSERGYQHYEVSSFCLPGARAVHNSLYWQGADYLGLGNGAASLLVHGSGAATRSQNRRSVARYLADAASQHLDLSEEIGAEEFARERLWLAMRTTDGVAEEESSELARVPASVWQGLEDQGLVERGAGRITPTIRGFLYNNQLIARLGIG